MNAERLLGSFLEMVKIESPSWHEAAMADYCVRALEDMGFAVRVDDSAAQTGSDTGNVIAHLPGTPGAAGRHIAFSAHMDTVVPCQGIEPVIETRAVEGAADKRGEGAVDARGEGAAGACADGGESFAVIRSAGDTILSADDKAGIAAIFEGVRATLEAASARPSITVVLTTCEEQSLLGASALDPAAFDPAMFNPPTTPTAEPAPEAVPCFVLDADGRPGSIVVGAPFHYTMRATFAGRAAHAGVEPEAGASAVQMAAHAIGNMPLGRIDERTTANVGVIAGGAAVNVVPGECRIEGECRSLYEDRVNAQRDAMTAACEAAAARFSGTVDVAWTVDYPGILHEPDAPVVQRLARAAEAAGLASRLTVSGGGADANVLGTKGACAVTLGIGMTNFHSVDEYIAVRDLEGAARYVEAIIAEYAR